MPIPPPGPWPSPITARHASTQTQFADVRWSSDGLRLLWLDGTSGQGRLWQKTGNEIRELSAGINVRGRLNYGGGEFSEKNGQILFASKEGVLYRPDASGQPQPLTSVGSLAASPTIAPQGDWAVCVLSEGEQNHLAAISLQQNSQNTIIHLASSADFHMDPVWSPDGTRIAWLEWDHPNLPFLGTRLMLAAVERSAVSINLSNIHQVSGGKDQPILQPAFSPDGRRIASGDHMQIIKIWDRDYVPQVRSLEGHKGQVQTLALSGDGQFVASAAKDKTIKL